MDVHIARDGVQLGHFPPDEVRRQLSAGMLLPADLAWSEGLPGWVPLATFPGLTPPPVPGAIAESAPPSRPPHVPPGNALVRYRVPATSAAAIASMVMGIFSFTFIPGIAGVVAIICGHVARSEIRRSRGELGGDGMALSGLIMGYFNLCLILLLVLLVLVPLVLFAGLANQKGFIFDRMLNAGEKPALTNARQVAIACLQYAHDHDENFPETLEALVPQYLPNRQSLTYPQTGLNAPLAYTYFGEMGKAPPDKILFKSKSADAGGRRVLAHVDGSVTLEPAQRATPKRTPMSTPAGDAEPGGRSERSVTPVL